MVFLDLWIPDLTWPQVVFLLSPFKPDAHRLSSESLYIGVYESQIFPGITSLIHSCPLTFGFSSSRSFIFGDSVTISLLVSLSRQPVLHAPVPKAREQLFLDTLKGKYG